MRWTNKARIMRICGRLPEGGRLYRAIQKKFGRLNVDPMSRLPVQGEMAKRVLESGREIVGRRFFEVGTGHVPVAPIGFFLCGADSVVTVDLHRRMEWGLTRESLEWMAGHRDEVYGALSNAVDEKVFDERFSALIDCQGDPATFFRHAEIEYLAPMDAGHTTLPDKSIDCHFSITVLEHIQKDIIRHIFIEAKRMLKPDGIAVHFVDLSDHFQHQDPSISKINFLRYSEAEWQRIAGNEFAYCNRLRTSDYLELFRRLNFAVVRHETSVDKDSKGALIQRTIPVNNQFSSYQIDDICSTSLRVLLKPSS